MTFAEIAAKCSDIPAGTCCCCLLTNKWPSRESKDAFKSITGRSWPRNTSDISLNLRQDMETLGVQIPDKPDRVNLCCACAVEYMLAFNVANNHCREAAQQS
jgi:hypothetical protein